MDVCKEVLVLKKEIFKYVKGIILVLENYDILYEYLEYYVMIKIMVLVDEKKKEEFLILFVKKLLLDVLKKKLNGFLIGKGKLIKFFKLVFMLNM